MLACHVGGLAWSGVSSAIVRLYNCLCVRGAYVLSAPVPTSSTFYQVFMGRLAWSGVLTGVSQTCMCYMDRLAWSGVAKYGARGRSRKGGVHVRDSKLRKASKSGWREEERHGSHSL